MNWHALGKEEIFEELETSQKGLSTEEVSKKTKEFGKNVIPEKKQLSPIILFLKQFQSYIVYVLIAAAIISFFLKNMVDFYVIFTVILINALIGFFQESKAEKSISALRKIIVSYAKVYRNGELIKIQSSELVPGDIVLIEEGDRIPADARIIESRNFRTNESALTGESFPIDKVEYNLLEEIKLQDRKNMIYLGTFAVNGSCKAVVISTGEKTEIGKIAKEIKEIPRQKTHFQKRTDFLTKQLGFFAVFIAILIFIVGYFIRGISFSEMSIFTLASLVSVIPEGLPAVLAIVLTIGAYRMSKRKAIIRNLPSTETLAVVTTIITDKTGTITKNTMNVNSIYLSGYEDIVVSGSGWELKGDFIQNEKSISPNENMQLSKLISIASLSNNARVFFDKEIKDYEIIGDPTEASLAVLAEKSGFNHNSFEELKLDDFPFNPQLKLRASLYKTKKKINELYVVGAPEVLLNRSSHILTKNTKYSLSVKEKRKLSNKIEEYAKNGMRVLAIAYKEEDSNKISESKINNLVIAGLVGIIDPPRPEVRDAIRKANEYGIRVIMATGDHKETALAIAKKIGLPALKVITGEELSEMSEKKFNSSLANFSVFARLTPDMKLKILEHLQSKGEIIAMTGDGINDAPALKKADIGIAMGKIGTDVARESSDMILVDDNFASIINAIEEAKIVFTNTRQASSYLVTTGIAEASIILLTLALNLPLPFLPAQILWLNLVTGGGSDISLATEKNHSKNTKNKIRKDENILSKEMIPFIILISSTMIIATLGAFYFYLDKSLELARTMAFSVMTLSQLFNIYNMRSLKKSVFKIGFFSNKWVNLATFVSLILFISVLSIPFFEKVFNFSQMGFFDVMILLILSPLVLLAGEVYKFIKQSS